MSDIPEYKLKIFTDALLALEIGTSSPRDFSALNAITIGDDAVAESFDSYADECGDDIGADLIKIHTGIQKARRAKSQKKSQKKYAQSERGKAIIAAAQKIWRQSDAGRAARQAWRQSDAGRGGG